MIREYQESEDKLYERFKLEFEMLNYSNVPKIEIIKQIYDTLAVVLYQDMNWSLNKESLFKEMLQYSDDPAVMKVCSKLLLDDINLSDDIIEELSKYPNVIEHSNKNIQKKIWMVNGTDLISKIKIIINQYINESSQNIELLLFNYEKAYL